MAKVSPRKNQASPRLNDQWISAADPACFLEAQTTTLLDKGYIEEVHIDFTHLVSHTAPITVAPQRI